MATTPVAVEAAAPLAGSVLVLMALINSVVRAAADVALLRLDASVLSIILMPLMKRSSAL